MKTLLFAGVIALAFTGLAVSPSEDAPLSSYRLIGYGCTGASDGPLYANEEDHFPKCRSIVSNQALELIKSCTTDSDCESKAAKVSVNCAKDATSLACEEDIDDLFDR